MRKEQSPTLYRGNVCKPMLEDYVKFEFKLYILKEINKKDGTLRLKENDSEKETVVETFKCDFLRRKSLKDQISIYKRYSHFPIKKEHYPQSEWNLYKDLFFFEE
jgi:hypothetical protein